MSQFNEQDISSTFSQNERIDKIIKFSRGEISQIEFEKVKAWFLGSDARTHVNDSMLYRIFGEATRAKVNLEKGASMGHPQATAVSHGRFKGMFSTSTQIGIKALQEFTGQPTYDIVFAELPDRKGYIGVDLIAGNYIDRKHGNFDILVMYGKTRDLLRNKFQSLYGGEWFEQVDNAVAGLAEDWYEQERNLPIQPSRLLKRLTSQSAQP